MYMVASQKIKRAQNNVPYHITCKFEIGGIIVQKAVGCFTEI